MSYPELQPLPLAAPVPASLSSQGSDLVWFRVSRAGRYSGTWFDLGDLVGCAPVAPPSCAAVVLQPTGRGAIGLGRVRGRALFGAFDEPCSPQRWRVVGPIAAVVHRTSSRVCQSPSQQPSLSSSAQRGQPRGSSAAWNQPQEPQAQGGLQLPLFACAA